MSKNFTKTETMIREAIAQGIFPSASILIAHRGEVVLESLYGDCNEETIFDVASITKPMITTTLTINAISNGLLKLEDRVGDYLDNCGAIAGVQIHHLLNHSSGVKRRERYYDEIPLKSVASKEAKDHIILSAANEQLLYKPGEACEYSDIDFILMGAIVEKVFAEPLNMLADEKIIERLGLKNSFFRAVEKTPWSDNSFTPAYQNYERSFEGIQFAPTEEGGWRHERIEGYVHDRNSYAMGGVAGHAGLFSNARDIYEFIIQLVDSKNGKADFLPKETLDLFIDDYVSTLAYSHKGSFLLGWDRPDRTYSQAGTKFSRKTIGHLAYTGCSIWVDLERQMTVIFLTNRSYPTSKNKRIKEFRPVLHDQIWTDLGV